MMNTNEYEMMEKVEEVFAEKLEKAGFDYWWQSEEQWDKWEEEMLSMKELDKEAVNQLFREMEEEI